MRGQFTEENLKEDFFLSSNDCTLIMIRHGHVILESSKRTLRPLVEALSLLNDWNSVIVYDKTVGLAAAKLHSLLEPKVIYTDMITKDAIKFLQDNHIEFHYNKCVEVILGDSKKTCPNEILARKLDAEELYEILLDKYDLDSNKDLSD